MNPISFHPEMALFRNLCVNLRDLWFGVLQYASAQSLDLTHTHFCGIALTGSLAAVQFRYLAELSLTLRKLGTRPDGVGLSPGTGRRKSLISEMETPAASSGVSGWTAIEHFTRYTPPPDDSSRSGIIAIFLLEWAPCL